MTTICYRAGVIAADSQATMGGLKMPTEPKIIMSGGRLIGAAGDATAINKFTAFIAGKGKKPKLAKGEEFSAIVVDRDGHIDHWEEGMEPDRVTLPFFAIGSGDELALGAMEMGATAVQAVEVAIKWDAASGGPVVSRRIEELK